MKHKRGTSWPKRFSKKAILGVVLLFTVSWSFDTTSAIAAEACDPWVAKIVSVEGAIEARRAQAVSWTPAQKGETFCEGDRVRVIQWRAAIVLSNETIIRLDQGTSVTFTKIEKERSSWLNLIEGIIHFISRVPQRLNITTPFLNAAVEGTEFVIQVDPGQRTRVWVFEGRVLVKNKFGQLLLTQDQAAEAQAGQAPRVIKVQPRDAVQWALHYPPLIDTRAVSLTGPNQLTLEGALAMYNQGDLVSALKQLDAVPRNRREAQFFTFRAGLLLSVGRIEQATKDLEQADAVDPGNGIAQALQSVIAVVQNDKDAALELALQATERAPNSPIPYIALSYAHQAHFDIDEALKSAQEATRLNSQDGLAWARVAELWLSKGHLDETLEAAKKAVAQNPDLARTQTVLGFAYLTQAKIKKARTAFEKAIELDQADPLPRLGLGLAKIQKSDLAEGRREIEIAASLDPNNAIVR
ncbi:MAG: FecR domain-containing protein, partial [Nitrospirota bacterium]|nr:FecR domain-containing protein [Nitrospirota bacterium]